MYAIKTFDKTRRKVLVRVIDNLIINGPPEGERIRATTTQGRTFYQLVLRG
jgi:hypothetical protein